MARGSSGIKMPAEKEKCEQAINESLFTRVFASGRKQIPRMANEKSPARISHRRFATSCSEKENCMYIIAGLGNPGTQYMGTRHNAGFSVIDELADKYNISVDTAKHKGLIGKGVIAGQKVILVKPMTYMNNSGECIREVMDYYKADIDDLIVIFDDISLEPGKLRLRAKGSAGGHNGIKSIIAQLGSDRFKRVKFGVGDKPKGWDLADWVLGKFPADLYDTLRDANQRACEAVTCIMTEGITGAMNKFSG